MVNEYIPAVLEAGWVTVALALSSIVLASILGLLGALCKLSANRLAVRCATWYTTIVRGIPDLVIMFMVFYSLPGLINQILAAAGGSGDFQLDPFFAGVSTLSLIFGAYMTETFRGALLQIPRGQMEAGYAFGLNASQVFTRIVLPQMVRLAIPGFTNNWLVLAKGTAIVSLIGLHDLMFRARGAAEATRDPFFFYLLAGAFYLVLTIVSLVGLRVLARRFHINVREVRL
jgi:arginine/ornithine transport system permease protein